MAKLKIGDEAPNFTLQNQDGLEVSLQSFKGKKIILYFYPKDNTPTCTAQACEFTQKIDEFSKKNAIIIGISADSAKSHLNFIEKYQLKHILLSDVDKTVIKSYNAWGLKKNYGKEYEGIIRTTFIIDEDLKILKIYENVKLKEHINTILEEI